MRVRGAESSAIVKQTLPYLRVAGEAWPLTRREQEVADLVAALSNKDIASRLVIS